MKRLLVLTVFSFFLTPGFLMAQHSGSKHTPLQQAEHEFKHWRIAALMGHTFIPALELDDRAAIPSCGLDIEYWVNPVWGVGMHNDLEIANFIIEDEHAEFLEREYPLVLTLDALYKPWKGLVLQAGPGMEIEQSENFFLVRVGVEYEFEFPGHWDVAPTFFYDSREDAYHTWSIAIGVGKRF